MLKYLHKNIIVSYLCILLFFSLPLVFSHIFSLVGVIIPGISPGYERYKIYFLIILTTLIGGIHYFKDTKKLLDQTIGILFGVGIIGLLCFYWVFFRENTFREIIIGSYEKHHGMVFFIVIIVLFGILRKVYTPALQRVLNQWSIYSAIIVSVYALLQYSGLDPIALKYSHNGWDVQRVFSTLGNPNYLAGYLLLLFPIISEFSRGKQTFLWILFSVIIVLTGSVIGIILTLGYILWKLLGMYQVGRRVWLIGIILIILGGCIFIILPHDKILSIATRFSLWTEAGQIFLQDPKILLFGNGPDTIHSYITQHHIIFDSRYFPPSSIIDSFHNIGIDLVFFFGFPFIVSCFLLLRRKWGYLPTSSKEGIILWLLFFSINIPISVHFLILIWYLTNQERDVKERRR